MQDAAAHFDMSVTAVTPVADGINMYQLKRADGNALPPAEPGAHIDLFLRDDLVRQYSLVVPDPQPAAYSICIKRDAKSRGGSMFAHESLAVGSSITISAPRNNFPLNEQANLSVFFAGGIGITPIWSMVQRMARWAKPWRLHYACRRRSEAAFLSEISGLGSHAQFHFDDENGGEPLDLAPLVQSASGGAHVYCCGPLPMLEAFRSLTSGFESNRVHFEYFSADAVAKAAGGFRVRLAKSGRELLIPLGRTILEVLREAGVNVSYSCQEGICGTCETRVLSGLPDHRDVVLTESERASGKSMMICCSGSLTPTLELDL
jgi:ferredoxin-NADP reductase